VGWIGTSTCTAQLNNTTSSISRIGTSTRSTQTTSKDRSSRIGTSIRVFTTLFRHRHEPPTLLPRTKTSLLLCSLELSFFCFLFFTKKRRRREKQNGESILTERRPPKLCQRSVTTSLVPGRAKVRDRDARCRLQEGHDARRTNDTVP
jgi:hypothetical protein